jgi:hypothetical protein
MGFYFLRAVRDSELEVNDKSKNDVNEFKVAYQPVTSLVKDEEAELLADHTAFCLGGRITSLCMDNDG